MSHTNTTPNYSLPQFITTDKPAWLTDINGAFTAIDTAVDNAQDAADAAQNDATQALTDASAAASAASTADAKGAGAVASIADTFDPTTVYSVGDYVMYNSLLYVCSVAVVTPGPWTGSTNWTRATVEGIIDGLTGDNIPIDSSPSAPSIKTEINGKAAAADVADLKDTIDVSGYFTLSGTITGDFLVRAYYNKGEKRVYGSAYCRSTGGTIATGQNMINILDPYRPQWGLTVPMMIITTTGVLPFYGSLSNTGLVTQTGSSNCTGVYFSFSYTVA